LQACGVEVSRGDGGDGFDGWVVCGALDGHEASHAVADEDEVGGVDAEFFGVGRVAQIGDGGLDVFDAVGEGEVAGRTPGAAVVEVEDVPARAANGLGEVEILLIAGEAVEEDDGGMRACSRGDVDEGVEEGSVAGELKRLHGSRILLVGNWIGGDGGLRGEGNSGAKEGCGEEEFLEAHAAIVGEDCLIHRHFLSEVPRV